MKGLEPLEIYGMEFIFKIARHQSGSKYTEATKQKTMRVKTSCISLSAKYI
jgi:hypothetical protein